jgi:hypothetical protein
MQGFCVSGEFDDRRMGPERVPKPAGSAVSERWCRLAGRASGLESTFISTSWFEMSTGAHSACASGAVGQRSDVGDRPSVGCQTTRVADPPTVQDLCSWQFSRSPEPYRSRISVQTSPPLVHS